MTSTKGVLDAFVDNLRVYFSLKILGVPQQLLGVTLSWGRNFSSVHLSSEKSIRELLRDFDMSDCKPASLPLPMGLKLLKSDCIPASDARLDPELKLMQSRYRTLVGTFIFISYNVQAEFEEMKGLGKARVAIECDLLPGRRAILGKWVFTIKRDSLGAIQRFKARICARGDMEIDGIDYSEVFSPVVSWVGIRIYLALTVLLGLIPLQLDIDLAYLYADLEEEVYMQPPPGVDITPRKVWLLQKYPSMV